MITLIICAIAGLVVFGSVYVLKQPAGNPIEKTAESVIDAELGLPQGSINLAPDVTNTTNESQVVAEAESVAKTVGEAALSAAETAVVNNAAQAATGIKPAQ